MQVRHMQSEYLHFVEDNLQHYLAALVVYTANCHGYYAIWLLATEEAVVNQSDCTRQV